MTTTDELDLAAPLPHGRTTLVEASAGTGKTFTIAGLAVRHVAETDDPLSSLLLVTFTRAATAELRSRVRAGLVAAERHLALPRPDAPVADPVLAALDAAGDDERALRRGRVARAVADFDTASISTIHGFCTQVRAAMGVLSAESTDAVPTENEAALIRQVCADLYFRMLTETDGDPPLGDLKLDGLVERVARARTLVDCEIECSATEGPGPAVAEFVRQAVAIVDDRLQAHGQVSFDSLVRSVRDGLRARPGLVTELRQRYRVAMVDEFQDTDPVQWEIFRSVFHDPAADGSRPTLVLVGDPKQAIYSFRGGDVYTYLAARDHAEPRALGTNQRSDRAVVEALNALGEGQLYGDEAIAYHHVAVAERNDARHATVGGRPASGLEVRVRDGKDASEPVRRDIAADLAAVVAARLADARLPDPDTGAMRAAEPRDFAVLVGSSSHARGVVAALRQVGIPTVLRLRDDVADSAAREQWRTLLHALDRPAVADRAAAAALTWFVGWEPERVAAAVDDPTGVGAADLVELQLALAAWSDRLTEKGLAALLGDLRRDGRFVARLLATPDGERHLTDLEHLAELIQAEAGSQGRGLTAGSALAVLDALGGTPDDELAADAAQRRIDSDADAVQVMTIHGAKGLEFPFVLLPTLWAGGARVQTGTPLTYFDEDRDRRIVDLSTGYVPPGNSSKKGVGKLKGATTASDLTRQQNCGDQHRLTYVALTRAAHQTIVWWADTGRSGANLTGLARLLFGGGDQPADTKLTLPDDWLAAIRDRVAAAGASEWVDVVAMDPAPDLAAIRVPPTGPVPAGPVEGHVAAALGRPLARDGRVWSFTALAPDHAAAHVTADPTVEASADLAAADEAPDEIPVAPESLAPVAPPPPSTASRFAGLGGGAELGNVVHHVFERIDFAAADPEAAVADVLAAPMPYNVTADQRAGLPDAIAAALRTPLPAALGGAPLATIGRRDRLDELRFDLPLAPRGGFPAAAIGELVLAHLPDGDPLEGWARQLASGLGPMPLEGFLTGSIDLVLRHGGDNPRFSVVDYKTNQLAAGGDTGLDAYRPDHLVAAMASHHYPLQALLYSVALHRYLRWRLPDYDPGTHLGAVGYLFVRGMVGPDTPVHDGTVAGVFTWAVPTDLVLALSELLAGAPDPGAQP